MRADHPIFAVFLVAVLSLLVYPTAARVLLARAQLGVAPAGTSSATAYSRHCLQYPTMSLTQEVE
jgi:hypothetical protein